MAEPPAGEPYCFLLHAALGISGKFIERLSQGKGRMILAAGGADQLAQESDELEHGYFTFFLLEGLRGAADRDSNQLISLDEAYRYGL